MDQLIIGEEIYFYKACLIRLSLECKSKKLTDINDLLNTYVKINKKFENSRSYKFLKNIISSIEENDIDKFTELLFKYDIVVKIPKDEIKLLNHIRNSFSI